MVTQANLDLTIAQLVPTFALEDWSLTCITKRVFTLELRSLEQTLKLCPDSGNTKLVLATASKSVTTCGFLDISFIESQKMSVFVYLSHPSFSPTGMVPAATPITQPKP
jgi:hypothetical protein